MIGWLYRLIVGTFKQCPHEWETIKQGHVITQGIGHTGRWYDLRCKKCGKIHGIET